MSRMNEDVASVDPAFPVVQWVVLAVPFRFLNRKYRVPPGPRPDKIHP